MTMATVSFHEGATNRASSPGSRRTRPLATLIARLGRPNKSLITALEKNDQSRACEILNNQKKSVWLDFETLKRALCMAAQLGHAHVVQLLVGKDTEADNTYSNRALVIASRYGHAQIVQQLIDNGVNVNVNFGSAEPKFRIDTGRDSKVLFTKEGGDNTVIGCTPLWHAAQGGHEQVVQLLLENGANANTTTHRGSTPLGEAIKGRHAEIVQLLLENDGVVNTATDVVSTPLGLAAERGYKQLVQLLIENGANVCGVDAVGNTPLIYAAARGHKEIVRMLVENGARVHGVDPFGNELVIQAAAAMRKQETIKTLLCV
jgi:ankyrin repeat protein